MFVSTFIFWESWSNHICVLKLNTCIHSLLAFNYYLKTVPTVYYCKMWMMLHLGLITWFWELFIFLTCSDFLVLCSLFLMWVTTGIVFTAPSTDQPSMLTPHVLLCVQMLLCVWELQRQQPKDWPTLNLRSLFTMESVLLSARLVSPLWRCAVLTS